MEEELLDTERVAEYLSVGQVTVWRWCREGVLPCIKIGRSWRIRRSSLEEFMRGAERPTTLVGQLNSFVTVPDDVIGVVQNRELMYALDAAFLRVGEARGGQLVKFAGGEPETNEEETRSNLERYGLEASQLELQGRFLLRPEPGPTMERADALKNLLDEVEEGGRTVWASFNWSQRVDLETAMAQQEALSELMEEDRPLVIETAVLEEIMSDWSPREQRSARELHSGMIWLSESGVAFSRMMPPPTLGSKEK